VAQLPILWARRRKPLIAQVVLPVGWPATARNGGPVVRIIGCAALDPCPRSGERL